MDECLHTMAPASQSRGPVFEGTRADRFLVIYYIIILLLSFIYNTRYCRRLGEIMPVFVQHSFAADIIYYIMYTCMYNIIIIIIILLLWCRRRRCAVATRWACISTKGHLRVRSYIQIYSTHYKHTCECAYNKRITLYLYLCINDEIVCVCTIIHVSDVAWCIVMHAGEIKWERPAGKLFTLRSRSHFDP